MLFVRASTRTAVLGGLGGTTAVQEVQVVYRTVPGTHTQVLTGLHGLAWFDTRAILNMRACPLKKIQ